jgi:hypothetical protein
MADAFTTLHDEFRALLGQVTSSQRRAQALLAAGRGAMSLRRWNIAEEHLAAAVVLAKGSGLHQEELEAEHALELVRERCEVPVPVVDPRGRAELALRAVKVLTGGASPRFV